MAAALFLRCAETSVKELLAKGALIGIKVTTNYYQFFGYQPLECILFRVTNLMLVHTNALALKMIGAKEGQKTTDLSRTSL